ncbi:MAG: peptidase [Balneolaceae bacterium]|nr:peptidase [Balneolaceae bacterium]MCH8549156.1 peptidase [Balneolaceae bacterium]
MITETVQSAARQEPPLNRKRELETGFPSPATDHLEERLNLNDYVVRHPVSTFFSKVNGEDEAGLGLSPGDILVIDRSLAPRHDSLVIADLGGEYRVCRLLKSGQEWLFELGNGRQIPVQFDDEFRSPIWGRVTHVIKSV